MSEQDNLWSIMRETGGQIAEPWWRNFIMSGSVSEHRPRFKYMNVRVPVRARIQLRECDVVSDHSILNSDQNVAIVKLSRNFTLAVDTVFRSTCSALSVNLAKWTISLLFTWTLSVGWTISGVTWHSVDVAKWWKLSNFTSEDYIFSIISLKGHVVLKTPTSGF